VLTRQESKLDNEYLQRRAKEAGVLTILKIIQALWEKIGKLESLEAFIKYV
jgi:hypothetical protein